MLYGLKNLNSDDVKNALIQRDLIKKQLTQLQNGSRERFFIRGKGVAQMVVVLVRRIRVCPSLGYPKRLKYFIIIS